MAKQVIDTWSGNLYPSLGACYQEMLQAGQLVEMEAQGRLAAQPAQDARGYARVRRYFAGRFIEEGDPDWETCREFMTAIDEKLSQEKPSC